ncbi:MAG: PEP-CTERM sorting domain-containing protein, partial [Pseudomonadota bacterium]
SLQPGQSASFALDVDSDAGVFQQDYRTILFNNGAAENALAEATFASASGPTTLALVLDDQPATDGIARFSAEQAISAPPSVPLPGTLPLALAAIAGFGFLSRRRAG